MRFGGSLKTGPKANCDSWKRKFPWADLQRPAKTNTMTMTNTFREHPQRGIFEDILRTPSNGNFREVLSLGIDSLFQTKIMGVDQILQISQSWNTWSKGSFAIFAMFNMKVDSYN